MFEFHQPVFKKIISADLRSYAWSFGHSDPDLSSVQWKKHPPHSRILSSHGQGSPNNNLHNPTFNKQINKHIACWYNFSFIDEFVNRLIGVILKSLVGKIIQEFRLIA